LLAGFGKFKQKITSESVKDKDLQAAITADLIDLLANNLKKHNSEENVRFWLDMVNADLVDEQTIAILVVNKCVTLLSNCKSTTSIYQNMLLVTSYTYPNLS
jgi:hypothetical protein